MRDFAKWVKDNDDIKTVVEIGVACMENARDLMVGAGRVFGVDPYIHYPEGHSYNGDVNNCVTQADQDLRYLAACELSIYSPNFTILRLTSEEAAGIFDDPVDAVYLDGDHSYEMVKKDIELWLPRCRYIGGHDWGDPQHYPGLMRAVKETLGEPDRLMDQGEWIKKTGVGEERA